MSRSFKKTPYCGLANNQKCKRKANKTFKHKINKLDITDSLAPGMYKRFFQSYDICDFYSIITLKEWMTSRRKWHKFIDEKKEISNWSKWYKRK